MQNTVSYTYRSVDDISKLIPSVIGFSIIEYIILILTLIGVYYLIYFLLPGLSIYKEMEAEKKEKLKKTLSLQKILITKKIEEEIEEEIKQEEEKKINKRT